MKNAAVSKMVIHIVGVTIASSRFFGGNVFHVEPLGFWDWLGVIGFTATVLAYAEVMRRIRSAIQ